MTVTHSDNGTRTTEECGNSCKKEEDSKTSKTSK